MTSPYSRSYYYDCYPYRRYYRIYPESVYYKKPSIISEQTNNNNFRKVITVAPPEVPTLPSGQKSFFLKISTTASDDWIQPDFRITLKKNRNSTRSSEECDEDHPTVPNDDDPGRDDDCDNNDNGGNIDPGKDDDCEDNSKGEDNNGSNDDNSDPGNDEDCEDDKSKENDESCCDENDDGNKGEDNGNGNDGEDDCEEEDGNDSKDTEDDNDENNDPIDNNNNNYTRALEVAKELKIQLNKLSKALE